MSPILIILKTDGNQACEKRYSDRRKASEPAIYVY